MSPNAAFERRMLERRAQIFDACEHILLSAKREGRSRLNAGEAARFAAAKADLDGLSDAIVEYRSERVRAGLDEEGGSPSLLARISRGSGSEGAERRGRMWAADTSDRLRAMGGEARAVVSGSLDVPVLLDIPPVPIPFPKRLIDVLGNRMQLESPGLAYEYYQQQAPRVNNAAPVPDLGTKPVSQLTVAAVQDRCRVVATLSDYVPARIWWNFDSINAWLYTQLYGCVLDEIEDQVIHGDGSGENMVGILHTTGTTAIAFNTDMPTTLRGAISAMQTLGEEPTAWCLNPADAQGIDLTRWGSAGGFLSGGYENDTGERYGTSANVFGPDSIARVITPHLPAGTALLADFSQLLLVFQQYMRLDIDAYSGFATNSVRFRAESFVGVGVIRPQAFAVVDLGAGTTTKTKASK
jgi:hypothetical protein